jgi:hypothetical protein
MRAFVFITALVVPLFFSCTKKNEKIDDFDYQPERLTEFFPLLQGKFITYRTDSVVYTDYGRKEETRSYQEKHVTDIQITDAQGRLSYRVYRFLRDTAGIQPWKFVGIYFVTPLSDQIQVVEGNRQINKLQLPIREGFVWNGNRFLAMDPYFFDFADDLHIDLGNWDFTYAQKDETINLNGKTINDVLTVNGPDESSNANISDPNRFGTRTLSIDKYAKNIGLIYQELVLWEYQPNPGGSGFRLGFSLKRSMIDHN